MAIQDPHWINHENNLPTTSPKLPKMGKNCMWNALETHRERNERAEYFYKLARKTCAKHCCMMHASLHEAMAPKLPKYGPILYKFDS